ncbi:acyclic terpene utilization AtuA family protein [Sinanaerobacter sp. ZZT-01]|uniref:acyclic terpene utilization AtuA family protein n=1 Tax=Sinanaerobacter sp. ZZT-01 TaxID=3111540 RepID=UPI002D79E558|nr:acyclic terpene utilization AtuA family protein [Sinanaerobacter sp. ZZT-01]WRR94059.1 acyclic terpene utilization AtuA family protein [Sinanaerobacter sp. ZZT-01]
MKKIRIGSGAGYAGDRIEPAVELMEKGNLDYIMFECLAERTIAIGQQDKMKDPKKGYNQLLEARMRKILPLAKKNGIKVITNMGSANPLAAAEVTVALAKELGVSGLKIAAVTGDDIFDDIKKYYDNHVLELDCSLGEIQESILSTNVYCGADGIIEALKNEADIIITGRVSDPALAIGPLVHEFGWNLEKNPEQMGQAVLVGHLLECGGQVTGGYYADPGYKDVPNLERLGFPLIEIDETGEIIVTKVEGSGGIVSTDTCKEQMIYEIHNPQKYMTPDVIADFSHVTFTQVGKDRVKAMHATSHGKPETLKVSVGYKDCFIGEGEISYGGSNCMNRAKLAAEIVEKRLQLIGVEMEEYRTDFIGYNSLYKSEISDQFAPDHFSEIRVRCSGRTKDRHNAELIANEVEALYTNGPAGGAGATKKVSEVVSICSIFVPREIVDIKVSYQEV